MPHEDDISLRTVLDHMRGMENRVISKFDTLELKVDKNHAEAQRNHHEEQRNHLQAMSALDNIDSRLDDIEVVQVPAIKKAVGMT